ncbi:hypothetical protein SAMN05660443_0486 [Marinospirillum celere]|uniref:Uncharacterized protein n=1 Tax=Marinospirillum celere TaxID=1122252 RepID=A0A1I1EB07_9GAMM|nr:hypothetical protein [Marinospirillum celere]SFB84319.1 hypothetical protein SAMN05660443_0486 [Marinospirillum celere]
MQKSTEASYTAYLQAKVDKARMQAAQGKASSHDDVEAEFVAKRNKATKKTA